MFVRSKNQSATFSRWLSLLLVVLILFGTTVEAAHRHGRITSSPAGAASQIDTEQTKNLASNKIQCHDCLICQLHQNLTTTLTTLRLNAPPTHLPQRVVTVVSRDLLSQIVSPLAGRAPPFIS